MADRGRRDTFGDDSTTKSSTGNKDKIKEEVMILAKKGTLGPAELAELYNKYGDQENLIDEILRLRTKRTARVKSQARKIAKKIYEKYSDGSRPLHEILDRMMRYKAENKWTDFEYDEFRKELGYLLTGARALEIDYNQNIQANRSRINRALGNDSITIDYGKGLRIKESEHGVLSEILSMYESTQALHKSVFMHSLMYEDCSLVAMTGEFKRDRHIASNFIHPLIACLYLPKFDLFEIHTLYSNFGAIIKARHEKKPILTEPDQLLFEDITSDPNDVVCEINSPMADIRNRFKVQIALWQTVIKLRNGNYYEDAPVSEFITLVNACRNNLYDNADLAYMQDEGALLRRFLSVFSLRPTIISTKPISSISSYLGGPMGMNMSMNMGMNLGNNGNEGLSFGTGFGTNMGLMAFPFSNQPVYTVTSIPMITLQIPPYTEGAEPKDLRTSTSQTIWINENKTIVPKEQSIIYSKEVLIFYVNRRIQRIQIRTFTNPLPFSQLPMTMSNFERLNKYPINVSPAITLGRSDETYLLRSVVTVNETEIKQGEKTTNIITGSSGLIMSHRNFDRNDFDSKYYLYDPFGASLPVRHPEQGQDGYFTNKPISIIEPFYSIPDPTTGIPHNKSFFERATETGTIYIYAKSTGYDPRQIISF